MIALIFCGDLKYCPYIERYVDRLKIKNIEYQIVFWNRTSESICEKENVVYYNKKSNLNTNFISKLFDFYVFRNWLIKYIKENQPEKCILLSTLTGIMLGKYLIKNKIPYLFDIRDYSYEFILPYMHIEEAVIKNSVDTMISSKGFTEFLPKVQNYVIAHNFNRNDIQKNARFYHNDKINFVWNGLVRYFDYQKGLISYLANDDRYQIIYHGDGPELLKYKFFCRENNINNIIFTGQYNNKDKSELLKEANILNNCYGYTKNEGNKLKYAVSNRFYDGIIYHIPQLVESSGYKAEWIRKLGIGTLYNPDANFANELYDYYNKININEFDKICQHELELIISEDDLFIKHIDDFIS